MTTSGTTDFTLDFTYIAELAFSRVGRELRSGWDLKLARMSMNLLTIEFVNRGLNLFTVEEGTLNLEEGEGEYDLPADTVDLLEHVIRTGGNSQSTQQDIAITRISVSTYATIPNKLAQGRPIQIYIDRAVDNPVVRVWPVPDQGTLADPYYVLKYWRMRRIQDAGSGVQTPDVNFRFLPVLVAGLAYYLGLNIPEAFDRVPLLKEEYERQWEVTAGEDRERASVTLVPYMYNMRGG